MTALGDDGSARNGGVLVRAHSSLSPSFAVRTAAADGQGLLPAYEIKFPLTETEAAEVERRLSAILAQDPNADPTLGGAYLITSLYTDTPGWSVYLREGAHPYRKYRVRRYGESPGVYLERKTVRARKVRKHREAAALDDLALLPGGDAGWSGAWFARQVARRELRPVCRIRYQRRALFGECAEGPMRVTFDRDVRGMLAGEWGFGDAGEERVLLPGVVVCEFKFRGTMPSPLKGIMGAMWLNPRGVSKYRACIDAFAGPLGLAGQERAPYA